MSRRKPQRENVDFRYGGVRLKCSSEHVLGRAILQRGEYSLERGLVRVEGPNGETKIKARCELCAENDRHPDLQVSWAKIKTVIDANAANGGGVSDYIIGG
jgi:hypothetical protein